MDRGLETISLELVNSYYDDSLSFTEAAKGLAEFYSNIGKDGFAEYILSLLPNNPNTLSTMEVDPLSKIARDLYTFVESKCGEDDPEVIDFRIRLAMYFDDFFKRCREEGRIKPLGSIV